MNDWGEFTAMRLQHELEQEQRLRNYEHRQAMTRYDHPHPDLKDLREILERWLRLPKKEKDSH
jgi:hypothetical protein